MKLRNFIALTAICSASIASAGGRAWVSFKSGHGMYTVQFPIKPQVVKSKVKAPDGGDVPLEMAMVESKTKAFLTCSVDASDYPSLQGREDDFLNMGMQQIRGKRGFQVEKESDFAVSGGKGRHILLTKPGAEMQVYAVVRGNKAVIAAFAGVPGTSSHEDTTKFIRSFKLASN